jgi:outer membrane protein assembly factor BamD
MTDHLSRTGPGEVRTRFWRGCSRAAVAALLVVVAACGAAGNKNVAPANNAQPDRFLMDRANDAMMKKQWTRAREYYRQVVDNYPQSPLRPDAKLGIGDTYLNEGGTENLILGANEFREFLTFYPTNPRADYSQYHLALCHFKQMRLPARDQTETKEAVKELQTFIDRYPNSPLLPEVKGKFREARDRVSEASFLVGKHYYTVKWDVGAVSRFREVLQDDPGFTNRDEVYFYLAESLARADKKTGAAQAIPYLDRLLTEFPNSEYADDARKRLDELKAESQAKAQ